MRREAPRGSWRRRASVRGFSQLLLVFLLLRLIIAGGSITVVAPASLAVDEVPPPTVFQPGDASSAIGPNSTSAHIYIYGSQNTTVDVVSNPGFTGTPDPWFYDEYDPNGYLGAGYDAGGGYAYMTGSIPFSWGNASYISAILQYVRVPAVGTVYGSVDWAYTMIGFSLLGVDLYVAVFDADWNLVAYVQVATLNLPNANPVWQTLSFNLTGLLSGPGAYYVGLLAVWHQLLFGYTATIYMDNFHLYVDDPSLYGAVVERSAVRIVNLHPAVNWTARLRVESCSYSGPVNWVNVSLTNILGDEASPEISFTGGSLPSNTTGSIRLSYSGSLNDTLYLAVVGDLGAPGAFLELNMTLVLDSSSGVVLEYPLILRVEQP